MRLRAGVVLVAVAVAVAVAGCSGRGKADEPVATPTRFKVAAGNAFGRTEAEWIEGKVSYVATERGTKRARTIRPSAEQWRRFWSDVDRLGVWRWNRSYELRPVVPDAESWTVILELDGRRVESEGLGTYPDARAQETRDRLRAFAPFMAAVDRLLGKPDG